MWKLVCKDLKLTLATKTAYWVLGLYWIFLFFLKSRMQPKGFADCAYIIVAFLVTAMVGSIGEGHDARIKTEMLYASLPLKRSTIVHAGYVSSFIFIFLGIFYTALAGWLIVTVFPESLFSNASLMSLEEALLVFAILFVNAIIHPPFNYRFGSQAKKKILYFFIITTTVLVSFWLLPMLFTLFHSNLPGIEHYREYGPAAPMVQAIEAFGSGSFRFLLWPVMGLFLLLSERLSVSFYKRRDL